MKGCRPPALGDYGASFEKKICGARIPDWRIFRLHGGNGRVDYPTIYQESGGRGSPTGPAEPVRRVATPLSSDFLSVVRHWALHRHPAPVHNAALFPVAGSSPGRARNTEFSDELFSGGRNEKNCTPKRGC